MTNPDTTIDHIQAKNLRYFSLLAGCWAIAIGALAWSSRLFMIHSASDIHAAWASLQLGIETGLMLAGLSLVCWLNIEKRPGLAVVARIAAIFTLVLGGLLYVQYAPGWNLGFARLRAAGTAGSGDIIALLTIAKMTSIQALCLVLFGLSLMVIGWRGRWVRIGEYLGLTMALCGFIYLSDFAFETIMARRLAGDIHFRPHISSAILLLGLGILCRRPDEGVLWLFVRNSVGGKMTRHMFPIIALLPTFLGMLTLTAVRYGYVDQEFQYCFMIVSSSITLLIVTWLIGRSLHFNDEVRQQAEIKLREKEESLTLALEAGKMGSWIWNIAENRSYWNQYLYTLLGLPPQDGWIATDLFFQHVHPDDRESLQQKIIATIEQRIPFQHQFRIVRADGAIRWLAGRGQIHDDNAMGKPQRMFGINFDITESKLADESLRENTEQLRLKTIELHSRLLQQKAVARLGELALQSTEINELFKEAARMISAVLEIEFCKIMELQPDGHSLLLRAGVGWQDGVVGSTWLDAGDKTQAGYVLRVRQPVIMTNIQSETRFQIPALFHQHGIVAGMSVIISVGKDDYGVLGAHTNTPRQFDSNDVYFLQNVAKVLGDYIESQRLEFRFRELVNSIQDYAIIMVSPAGNIRSWNTGAKRITGYDPEAMIGRTLERLYPAADGIADKLHDELKEVEKHGRIERVEWRLRQDGSRFLARCITVVMRDRVTSQLTNFSCIIQDITSQKYVECGLHSITANSVDAIVTVNPQGIMEWSSGSIHKIFGYDPVALIGQNITMLSAEFGKNRDRDTIANYFATTRGGIREIAGQHQNGAQIPLEIIMTDYTIDGARFFIAIMRDVSGRKQLEAELRQSQKMEAIGQLAGGIAHDFNNLLSIINGYGELYLLKFSLTEPEKAMLKEIINAGKRAAVLTGQLLAFSRKQILSPRVLNLNGVVLAISKMLQRLIGEDIGLTTTLDPTLGLVKADPGQLDQVIMNLAVNARDAMPGGGRLTISTHNQKIEPGESGSHGHGSPGDYILLKITDTGCGMSAATKARIFEPFFTTKEVGKGTGLGLATVFGIIKQSEGHIVVESEIDQGTTFKIYFPTVKEARPDLLASASALPSALRGDETVLLVEDESNLRRIGRLILEEYGYRVIEAGNGYEALAILKAQKDSTALVISDVVMPEMGGVRLAEELQRHYPAMKILFMSGHIQDTLLRQGLDVAKVSILHKPLDPVDLVRKVRALLDA